MYLPSFRGIIQVLTVVLGSVTVVLTYNRWLQNTPNEARLGFIAVTAYAGGLLLLYTLQQFFYSRKARYPEALESIRQAASTVRQPFDNTDACLAVLKEIVREASEAFTLISGARVNACVKCVTEDQSSPGRFRVIDFCRDPKSAGRRGQSQVRHWVDFNTDFDYLWRHAGTPRGEFFLAHDLTHAYDYRNTSFEIYGLPNRWNFPLVGPLVRALQWPLPYKSTLVVPIGQPEKRELAVVGYFCLDCRNRWAFNARYDVPLLRAFAELCYPAMDAYLTSTRRAKETGMEVRGEGSGGEGRP
jgi:hypothetical protein